MRIVDVIGAFLMGILAVSALSLIVMPNSTFASAIKSTGDALSGLVLASKVSV